MIIVYNKLFILFDFAINYLAWWSLLLTSYFYDGKYGSLLHLATYPILLHHLK